MSVSFNQPSQYPVSALNVKPAQKPDEAAKASFKANSKADERLKYHDALCTGIPAVTLGSIAGLITGELSGKGLKTTLISGLIGAVVLGGGITALICSAKNKSAVPENQKLDAKV